MRKPCDMYSKRFTEQITEINNFLPLFPGSDRTKKITVEEINEIILHAVPKIRERQSYLQGCDF